MQFKSSRILIYDKTDYLTKLVKHYCGNNIDLILHDNDKIFDISILDDVDVVYIKTNKWSDLGDVKLIHDSVKQLFIDTSSIRLINATQKLKNVFYFNLETDKYNIMTQIFNNAMELQ